MTAAVVALAVAVLLLSVLVAGLLRSHAEILKSLHDLGAGLELDREGGPTPVSIDRRPETQVPGELSGTTLDGEIVATSLVGQETLIAFLSSGCTTCQEFWTSFARGRPPVPGDARLFVVTKGLGEESESALREREPAEVPLLMSDDAWDDFAVPGSPYFAYVDATGRVVGEGTGTSWTQITTMLSQARADAAMQQSGNGKTRDGRDSSALSAAGIEPGHPSLYGEGGP
jgi:hypothetical protein